MLAMHINYIYETTVCNHRSTALKVNLATLCSKAYMGIVRPQLEYCSTIWVRRLSVKNNYSIYMYKIEMVHWELHYWHWNDTITHPVSLRCLTTWAGNPLNNTGDACFSLLHRVYYIVSRNYLLPIMHKTRHTHCNSFIPPFTSITVSPSTLHVEQCPSETVYFTPLSLMTNPTNNPHSWGVGCNGQ